VFSLRFVFVLIALVALSCGALVNPSPIWGSGIITLTIAVGVGATIAVWRSSRSRVFYGPLAGVIWLYLLVLFCDPLKGLEKNLISSKLIFVWWSQVKTDRITPPNTYVDADVWAGDFYNSLQPVAGRGTNTSWVRLRALTGVYYTVHCSAAVLLGAAAGILTVRASRSTG
jgi:hypothetical protein